MILGIRGEKGTKGDQGPYGKYFFESITYSDDDEVQYFRCHFPVLCINVKCFSHCFFGKEQK